MMLTSVYFPFFVDKLSAVSQLLLFPVVSATSHIATMQTALCLTYIYVRGRVVGIELDD